MNPSTTPTPRTDAVIQSPNSFYMVRVENLCRELERELVEKTNEVAKLHKYVEKLEIYSPENDWSHPEWRKLIGSKEQSEDPDTLFKLYQFRFEPDIRGETNEVARLREAIKPFLRFANGIPDNWPEQCILRFDQRNDGSLYINYYEVQDASDGITIKQWRELARLATTPEEPVIQDSRITELQKAISQAINSVSAENGSDTPDFILAEFLTECLMAWNKATKKRTDWHSPEETQDGVTMEQWYGGFAKIESTEPTIKESLTTEPVSEWRELSADEVICEWDEIQWPEKDWQTAKSSVGYKVGYWDGLVKARTRRPFPKQEEMPLEDELKDIDQYADKQNDFYTCRVFQSIEYSLHYLRDEIQKLKCL